MTITRSEPIHIIGGGLAGSEAAWQIARAGLPVVVHEMRPVRPTEAHKTQDLAEAIAQLGGEEHLAFFDAIAPIIHKDSIDFDKAWYQSRYDKVGPGGTGLDYINCPLDRDQYEAFVDALLSRETTSFKQWEGTP